jgi:hypothetical protein
VASCVPGKQAQLALDLAQPKKQRVLAQEQITITTSQPKTLTLQQGLLVCWQVAPVLAVAVAQVAQVVVVVILAVAVVAIPQTLLQCIAAQPTRSLTVCVTVAHEHQHQHQPFDQSVTQPLDHQYQRQ